MDLGHPPETRGGKEPGGTRPDVRRSWLPCARPPPIQAGRLEIRLHGAPLWASASISVPRLAGHARSAGNVEALLQCAAPVAILRIPGSGRGWVAPLSGLKRLGYPPAQEGREGEWKWDRHTATGGSEFACCSWGGEIGDAMEMAIAITSTEDPPDPVAEGRRRVERALGLGYARLLPPHTQLVVGVRSKSRVSVPDLGRVLTHYDEVQQLLRRRRRAMARPPGSARGGTADEGDLPNLAFRLSPRPQHPTSGPGASPRRHFEEGSRVPWTLREPPPNTVTSPLLLRYSRRGRSRRGAPWMGAHGPPGPRPSVLHGRSRAGAVVARALALHHGPEVPSRNASPLAPGHRPRSAEGPPKAGPGGRLKLPLSSSPKIHDNTLRAWLTPNSNFDLALFAMAVRRAGGDAPSGRAAPPKPRACSGCSTTGRFVWKAPRGRCALAPGESLAGTAPNRDHCLLLPNPYLLGAACRRRSRADRAFFSGFFPARHQRLGRLGLSPPTMAARIGQPERLLRNLRIFLDGFISRNGFHLNRDYQGKGYVTCPAALQHRGS